MADHAQRTGRGDPGVLLPQRPGRGVARVGEDGPARLDVRLVELLERRHRQEHLAAHLHQRRQGEGVGGREPVRHALDGLHVGRDVLPRRPVAAGQGTRQAAVLVEQVDREPVDLELAEQVGVRDALAAQPLVPGLELVGGEGVVQALHPLQVIDGRELRGDRAADLLGGRVGCPQLTELLLQLLQPAHPGVERGVVQRRVVEHVVAPARLLDLLGEALVLLAPRVRRDRGLAGGGIGR